MASTSLYDMLTANYYCKVNLINNSDGVVTAVYVIESYLIRETHNSITVVVTCVSKSGTMTTYNMNITGASTAANYMITNGVFDARDNWSAQTAGVSLTGGFITVDYADRDVGGDDGTDKN